MPETMKNDGNRLAGNGELALVEGLPRRFTWRGGQGRYSAPPGSVGWRRGCRRRWRDSEEGAVAMGFFPWLLGVEEKKGEEREQVRMTWTMGRKRASGPYQR
jgi:hypothetical protein